jgi:Arc/MetJ family transcription regulator
MVVKHLVDIDEQALSDARAMLGTVTIKDTVNTALRLAAEQEQHAARVDAALAVLGELQLTDEVRQDAWS